MAWILQYKPPLSSKMMKIQQSEIKLGKQSKWDQN
jgi:hypothetical protein